MPSSEKQVLIQALKQKHESNSVFACAPTGVAALLIDGQTLHSLAGCGVPTKKDDMKKMWADMAKKRWRKMKVLVSRADVFNCHATIEIAKRRISLLFIADAEAKPIHYFAEVVSWI